MTDPNQPPSYPPSSSGPPSYQQPSYPPSSQPSQPSYPSWQPSYGQTPSYQQSPSTYPPSSYPSSYGSGSAPQSAGPVPGRVLGIVALIGAIVISPLSLVWLVLGIVAMVQSRRAGRKNGFALAAIIVSIVAFIIWTVVIVYSIYLGVQLAQLCQQYGTGDYEINGNPVHLTCG